MNRLTYGELQRTQAGTAVSFDGYDYVVPVDVLLLGNGARVVSAVSFWAEKPTVIRATARLWFGVRFGSETDPDFLYVEEGENYPANEVSDTTFAYSVDSNGHITV